MLQLDIDESWREQGSELTAIGSLSRLGCEGLAQLNVAQLMIYQACFACDGDLLLLLLLLLLWN